ncbi:hypothetical protein R1sor_007696 [Riccia sorocarpa]|uniref:Uncharacterized protein n=1 Tax=Riccia sorocarpa TaxID=122646 RepID=A0ABD3HUU0_9MARC
MSRSVHLFQMVRPNTDPVSVGLIGFKDGDTLASLRCKLETTGVFSSFQFWDSRVSSPVHPKLEILIFVEKCEGKSLCSKLQNFHLLLRGIAVQASLRDLSQMMVLILTHGVRLRNSLMNPTAVEIWRDQVEKLLKWADTFKKTDNLWRVKTWDQENVVHGILECMECQSSQGKAQGSEDKMAIVNLFLNFRTKHLNSEKHKVNWCRRKNVDVTSLPAKSTTEKVDHRAETNKALEIVEKSMTRRTERRNLLLWKGMSIENLVTLGSTWFVVYYAVTSLNWCR